MKTTFLLIVCMMSIPFSSQAQDWAQLSRFEKANAALEKPTPNENRVVFMGNSITEGWVQDRLSLFKNPAYINRGIGGQVTAQMKIRFWNDVIELQPKVVVILAGINDIAQNQGYISIEDTAKNISEMAELANSFNIKVVICSVLPANYFPWRPQIKPADKVIALNELLKKMATENGYTYLDYYTTMVNEEKGMMQAYTTDGVHCTLKGYQVMEGLVSEVLERLLQ